MYATHQDRSIISHFRRGNKAVKREGDAFLAASCREVAQALDIRQVLKGKLTFASKKRK